MAIVAINPATNEIIKEYQELTPDEVRSIIMKADAAFRDWRRTSFAERAALMRKAARILRDKSVEYGELMTQEMGKLLQQGKGEAPLLPGRAQAASAQANGPAERAEPGAEDGVPGELPSTWPVHE